jgi:hypothetical protein
MQNTKERSAHLGTAGKLRHALVVSCKELMDQPFALNCILQHTVCNVPDIWWSIMHLLQQCLSGTALGVLESVITLNAGWWSSWDAVARAAGSF